MRLCILTSHLCRTASRCNGPSVPCVSLPGPTGVPPMPRQDGIGSRAPTLVVALCRWWWTCHVGVAHTRVLQHSTAQHSTAQHSTAQHSTAQHSTAQHSTAQHSTAQHSTAQHSTRHSGAREDKEDEKSGQSRRGYHYESHGFSCRLSALGLNFSPL